MTSDQHAHANPQQVYDNLSNELADILLGPDSPVRGNPEFDESIAEHDRLTKRQDELQALDAKLVEILPGLEQVEARLTEATKQLAAEKKKLARFAGELGKAAFAGLRAGELPDHPLFADRKELQSRVESLQRQKAELVAGENAGMMEKAKVQAQQLKLTGQIKVEELKIGSLDRALGTALLTSKEKLSVQCGQSEEVLKAIADQRQLIENCRQKAKQAEQTVGDLRADATKILDRSGVGDAATLKTELRDVRKDDHQNQKAIHKARHSTVDAALKSHLLSKNVVVGEKLRELKAQAGLSVKQTQQGLKLLQSLYSRWKTLPPRTQIGVASAPVLAVMLFAAMGYFRGESSNQFDETMGDASQFQIVQRIKDANEHPQVDDARDDDAPPPLAGAAVKPGIANNQFDETMGDASHFQIVQQIENANEHPQVDDARDDDAPPPLAGAAVKPGIAKWTQWPQPDEIVAEMGSLTMLQATKPVNHGFTVLQQISDGVYEIQIELPLQSKGRAVLSTVTTTFQNEGRAVLPLTYSGTQSFSLENGFQRQIRVFHEAAGLSPKEAAIREREYFDEMKDLRRLLTCSTIHFNVPITSEWKDFHAAVGADKWEEMISDNSLYLSKRTKDFFSIEITSAYRETKEAMEKNYSPVHHAAQKRDLLTLNVLANLGESLAELGEVGLPPLHVAFESYLQERRDRLSVDFVETLFNWFSDRGVDVKQVDSRKRSLIHLVALNSFKEISTLDSLLRLLGQRGFDLRAADLPGNKPIHLVLESVITKETVSRQGRPLMVSSNAAKRCGDVLDIFATNGMDLLSHDEQGNNLIHKVCEVADVELLKMVLSKGINVDQKNKSGDTPLLLLSKKWGTVTDHDRVPIEQSVKLLLEKKANKLIRDSNGKSAAFHLGDSLRHLLLVESFSLVLGDTNQSWWLLPGKDASLFVGTAEGFDHRVVRMDSAGNVLGITELQDLKGTISAVSDVETGLLRVTTGQANTSTSMSFDEITATGETQRKIIQFRSNRQFLDDTSQFFKEGGVNQLTENLIYRTESVLRKSGGGKSWGAIYNYAGKELFRQEGRVTLHPGELIRVVGNKDTKVFHRDSLVAKYDTERFDTRQLVYRRGIGLIVRGEDSLLIFEQGKTEPSEIPIGYGPDEAFEVFGNLAIVGNRGNDVYCIDTRSAKKLWKASGRRVDGGLQLSSDGSWYWISGSNLIRYSSNGILVGECSLPEVGGPCWLGDSKLVYLSSSFTNFQLSSLHLNVVDVSEW